MNIAAYMRVSTSEQTIDLQRDAINALCARHPDWNIVEYIDQGVSGAKDSRPALDKMMADARRGKIDRVVVFKFDRFARSTAHLLRALEEFQALHIDFVSVTEAIDTSTPMGRMTFTVLGAVAELERSLTIERVRAGQKAARARGRHIGRRFTYQSSHVALVRHLRSSGASVRAIAVQAGLTKSVVQRIIAQVA